MVSSRSPTTLTKPKNTPPKSSSSSSSNSNRRSLWWYATSTCVLVLGVALLGFVSFVMEEQTEIGLPTISSTTGDDSQKSIWKEEDYSSMIVPRELMQAGLYHPNDFENVRGIAPSYWGNTTTTTTTTMTNTPIQQWGPCYAPSKTIPWAEALQKDNKHKLVYNRDNRLWNFRSVEGGCRPGFLIIGAGKCGTSSLYHYLTGHPRVVPAIEKQIHYFKASTVLYCIVLCFIVYTTMQSYSHIILILFIVFLRKQYHASKPLGWYFSWFPTTQTFLESGALMTGEASPGYLPYPEVARLVKKEMPGPKIVTVGRNPLERSYSSYRYNYLEPTRAALKTGRVHTIKRNQPDEMYEPYLFSFEQFIQAELKQLQKCIYGFGIDLTRKRWYKSNRWTHEEFDRRQQPPQDDNNNTLVNNNPLIDMDHVCYGDYVNNTVLRPQWAELQMANPQKVILSNTAFLTQSLIGRSIYVLPLEWWYINFDPQDMMFVCTEDLSDPQTMTELALQLGLPEYDFSDVIAQGAFNVGGHKGYDEATDWTIVEQETTKHNEDIIPLSDAVKQEYLDFVRPFNERLFQLVGKRCQWD